MFAYARGRLVLRLAVTVFPDLGELVRMYKQTEARSDHLDRMAQWHDWYQSCFVLVLRRSLDKAAAINVILRHVALEIFQRKRAEHASIQRVLQSQLVAHSFTREILENRFSQKLARWRMSVPIGVSSRRAPKRLQHLSGLFAPRVLSAMFKALWNGWCTARRFQKVTCSRLQCSGTADDSIEHPLVLKFATERFKLEAKMITLERVLCLVGGMTDEELVAMSVLVYIVFREVHSFRNSPPDASTVFDAFEQRYKVAVNGHPSGNVLSDACRSRVCGRDV